MQETTTTSHPFGMQPLRNSDQGEVEGDVGFVSHEMVPSGCTSGCDGKGKGSLMGAGQHSGSLCPGARQEGWEEVQLQGQMRLTPISLLEAPDLHQPLLMADEALFHFQAPASQQLLSPVRVGTAALSHASDSVWQPEASQPAPAGIAAGHGKRCGTCPSPEHLSPSICSCWAAAASAARDLGTASSLAYIRNSSPEH